MNRILGLIIVLCVVFASTQALQAHEPQTKEGTKALFWSFSGLSDISVDNSMLGFKVNISDGVGLWGALGLAMVNTSDEDKDLRAGTGVELALGAQLYLFETEPVAMFISPLVAFSTASSENKISEVTDSEMGLSIGAAIGAEWWFANNVSLSAQTFVGFQSTSTSSELGENKSENNMTFIGIGGNYGSKFTLSFYFR
ncbi:MAG: hypothetical protein CVV22_06460 [Ignavibacteriae bacterium HGW-Ignavibacteriae-1]|jgi:hypothetical protein|nr:MAG: hypothetical protein CVV22_06460 [Ignavibacteriae bacterium HGW-Ignavibacteriae-1]